MAGINSRQKFDTCDIDNILSISMNPGKYSVSQDQIAQLPMCVNNTQRINTRIGRVSALDNQNSGTLVDIESHLFNLDTPLSNCSLNRTLNDKNITGNKLVNNLELGTCSVEQLQTIYSKLDIPSYLPREATTHRFDFPIIPPSDFTYFGIEGTEQSGNNRDGINTRLKAKDNFRFRRTM